MNRKKTSVIFVLIPFCAILSSCSEQETNDNSTMDVSLSNKTIQITETDMVTSLSTFTENVISTGISETACVSSASAVSEAEASSVSGSFVPEEILITSYSSDAVQTSTPLTTTSASAAETTPVSSGSVPAVQSEQTEEVYEFDKVGGKWCFNGKEGTAYILIYENGGWIQYDENDNETASGILETENGNDYSMFTSDKQQYSDFTLKDEDYFKTSDGKDYYREYRNTND